MRNKYFLVYNRKNSKRLEIGKKYNKIQLNKLKPTYYMEIGSPLILSYNIDEALSYSSLRKLIKEYIYQNVDTVNNIYSEIINSTNDWEIEENISDDEHSNDELGFDFNEDPLTEEEIMDEIFNDNISYLLSEFVDILVRDTNDHYYIMEKGAIEEKIYDTHEQVLIDNTKPEDIHGHNSVVEFDKYIKYIIDNNKKKFKEKLMIVIFDNGDLYQVSLNANKAIKYGGNKKDDYMFRLTMGNLSPEEIISVQIFMDGSNPTKSFAERYSFQNTSEGLINLSAEQCKELYYMGIENGIKNKPELLNEEIGEELKNLSIFCDLTGERIMS